MAEKKDFHNQPTIQAPAITPQQPPADIPVPEYIGPYKIDGLLEKGGMNVIYLGTHPETREPTIIKALLPKFHSHPDVVQRFINEAEIIAMTDHPNIVKLYGHGEWENGLYIAMEFIQGISLRQSLIQNPISLKRALEIVIDIAYALCHLHTHGVIHRDLKPENILLTESGQVKVIDFGIAQLLTEKDNKGVTVKQRLIGTPIYMSPEQQENPESVSYPSDIYSLGIITYELVLGKLSHGHIHLSLMPKGLQKILTKALQPDPKERYQDVVDYITEITNYLNSSEIQKERKISDRISELSEGFRSAQDFMTPAKPKNWDCLDVGVATHQSLHMMGLYYDFIELTDGNYGVIIAESAGHGAESIILLAMLRGIIQTLINQTTDPIELATRLNKIIIDQHIGQVFAFNFLTINPNTDSFELLTCGYGNLWHFAKRVPTLVVSKNAPLGIDKNLEFHITAESWNQNDILILTLYPSNISMEPTPTTTLPTFFQQVINETSDESSQKIAETLLRKARIDLAKESGEKSITLIVLKKM